MRLWTLLLVVALGCGKKKKEDAEQAPVVPESCVAGDEVCAKFDADWSQEEADDLCAELDGEPGECAEEPLGYCEFEDGLQYLLYGLTPRDAESYCIYLGGDWAEAGDDGAGEA